MESGLIYIHDGEESVPEGFESVQTPGNNQVNFFCITLRNAKAKDLRYDISVIICHKNPYTYLP